MTSSEILARLVGFASVSSRSNRDIADYLATHLRAHGFLTECMPVRDKVNVFASIGPATDNGVILSGHMDVVPVEGQSWISDPFRLTERDGRLFGRGTADMKGFLACVLALASRIDARRLVAPLHIALSHDEEIGCVGVRPMLDTLAARNLRARACIVGEPTGLRVATGHKGKLAASVTCRGLARHSAMAPQALNAIHLATDFVALLRHEQARLAESGPHDGAYVVPYSTLHAGLIHGGTALNIVPDTCTLAFEIRTVSADDPGALLALIDGAARSALVPVQRRFPAAAIEITTDNAYPGLDTPPNSDVVAFATALAASPKTMKVAFGTEGGLFAEKLSVPTVICGPGSMDQGHKPDEFITRAQVDRCDAMLDRLVGILSE